jgi:alanine racemase
MARAGVRWDALGDDLVAAARAHPPEGAFTHFHSADCADGTREAQEARFAAALARLPARPLLLHAENSPAVVRGGRPRGTSSARAVPVRRVVRVDDGGRRCGRVAGATLGRPEPVAHLRARVVDVRDVRAGESVSYGATWRARGRGGSRPSRRGTRTATAGALGPRRGAGGGREAPVVGRVTMDMTMLDVTDAPCAVGDVATLLGRDGDRVLTVDDVARRGDLSPYELLAGLRLRVPHVYLAE